MMNDESKAASRRSLFILHPSSFILRCRSGRAYWGILGFICFFAILLLLVSYGFLFPAIEAASDATAQEKRHLAAFARLLLAILLIVLVLGLLLSVRFGRFFQPRSRQPTKTQYVDAWEESGRRMQVPPEEKEEE